MSKYPDDFHIGYFAAKNESNNNPGCVSTGIGDHGGKSYGLYQMTATTVSQYLKNYNYIQLRDHEIGTLAFDDAWKRFALDHKAAFIVSQTDYIKDSHFDAMNKVMYDRYQIRLDRINAVLDAVLFSRAVQFGARLGAKVCSLGFSKRHSPSNIAYNSIDISHIITDIYEECDDKNPATGGLLYFPSSPAMWKGLSKRFDSECKEALKIYANSLNRA